MADLTVSANVDSMLAAADYAAIKTLLSINNVNNTTDALKPVSAAQQAAIDAAITALVGGAPAALNTLVELSASLADDANAMATLVSALAGKQATLVSGTNLRTVNGNTLLGSTDLVVGGNVATDAIFDAAGDLPVGTGSNTAARLPIGTALQVLRVNAGATALEYSTPSGGDPTFADEAADATCFVAFVTAADGVLGPKTNASLKFDSATKRLTIGSATSTDDGTFISTRPTTGAGPHAFRDEGIHNASANGGGYGSFDAATTIDGTSNYNHSASFQSRQTFNGSGTLTELRGMSLANVHNGTGVISFHQQLKVVPLAGVGPVLNDIGVYSEMNTTRGTNNYFLYHVGGAQSYHKGRLEVTLGATEANHNGETTDGGQIVVSGFGLSSSQMQIGYNTTGDYGWFQAAEYGASYNPIKINPNGGDVEVGTGAKTDNNATAGNTRLFVYDVDNATLERVTVGAADSGGSGFKLLRIPN